MFRLSDYDYELPAALVAQHPVAQRDQSRLMQLDRRTGTVLHRRFAEIPSLLSPGDVLVLNNTRVVPGRLLGRKDTGGKVEVLILDYAQGADRGIFTCLVKASKRPRAGSRIWFHRGLTAQVLAVADQTATLAFSGAADLDQALETIGHMPLPPYIHRDDASADRSSYQTVYATHKGAIAAPTAGLHFTRALLERLAGMGVRIAFLTLHVGYGTFVPVRCEDIREHRMHAEWFTLPPETAAAINRAKADGRRVVAVGTTCVRTLEYCTDAHGGIASRSGLCDLYIYPGYRFRLVDAVITNFHLPKSTLLMLVSAFAGRENVLRAYDEAVREKYRFYSYGDGMIILSS